MELSSVLIRIPFMDDYRIYSNSQLLAHLRELAAQERKTTADFLACLAEVDRRPEVVLSEGFAGLFDFCVRDLRLSESTAYKRVRAARLARARPEILSLLADGSINLSNLCLIAPALESSPDLLDRIIGKRKREVEMLIAALGGSALVPDRIRILPPATTAPIERDLFAAAASPTAPLSTVRSAAPPAPDRPQEEPRAEFRFAAGRPFVEAVERLRSLLWHKYPSGRLEDLLFEAASEFIARRGPLGAGLPAVTVAPSDPRARRVPAAVRRAVWRRDGGRCAFTGPAGRCPATRGLEIDHIKPWALGGASNDASNLRLLCRFHNQSEARRLLGRRVLPGETPVDKS